MSVDTDRSDAAALDALKERLAEPKVATALHDLLDHADLVSLMVIALDGFLRRFEDIGNAAIDGMSDLKGLAATDGKPFDEHQLADLLSSIVSMSTLLPRIATGSTKIVDSGAVETVLDSGVFDAPVVEQIGRIGRGIAAGAERDAKAPLRVGGPLALYKALRDPEIARGLGFFLAVTKAIGRELDDRPGR